MIVLENGKHRVTIELTPDGGLLESRAPLNQLTRKKVASIPAGSMAGIMPEQRASQLVERLVKQGFNLLENKLRPSWTLRVIADDPEGMRLRLARILAAAKEEWKEDQLYLPGTLLRLSPRSRQLRMLAELPAPPDEVPWDRSFDLPLLIAGCIGYQPELVRDDGESSDVVTQLKLRSDRWTLNQVEPLYAFGVLTRPFQANAFKGISRHRAAF